MRLYAVLVTAFATALVAEGITPPHQSDAAYIAGNVGRIGYKRSNVVGSTLTVRSTDTCTCDDEGTSIGIPVIDTTTNTTDTNTTATGTAEIEYFFDQLIDHTNPSLGTFKQRYWFSAAVWAGQGSPIVLANPGEQSAEGFNADLTGHSMMNALMRELGAAGVVLEHRYWGKSSPFADLTTQNLQYLTLNQSMEDHKYFVENVKLPWGNDQVQSTPDVVPWVQIGCSYPGLLAAYIQNRWPTLFAASWASSAPVEADTDFWEYFTPIEQGMPKNCSTDTGLVVDYVDNILSAGTAEEKTALKSKFGMQDTQDDDFANTIVRVMFSWQSMQAWSFYYNGYDPFYMWCDAMEVSADGTIAGEGGVGLDKALQGYTQFFKTRWSDYYCPGGACFTTYDLTSGQYTDYTVENQWNRQWMWFVCNEFGWFQTGDPGQGSRVVSKFVTVEYNLRQCAHMFPKADGTPGDYSLDAKVANNNVVNEGWNLMADYLFVTNGEFDPWRSASLSSAYAPGVQDSPHQKIVVIPGGHHCWDWSLANADVNSDVAKVISMGITQMKAWVENWYLNHPNTPHTMSLVPSVGRSSNTRTGGKSLDDVNTPSVDSVSEGITDQANSTLSDLQASYDSVQKKLENNKPLMWASLGLNAALALALAVVAILFFRRRKTDRMPAGNFAVVTKGDGASKGRGKYQTLGYPPVDEEDKR